MKDQTRNLNPHKAAVAAMWIWADRYSKQGGGSMDFWDSLSESQKKIARTLVKDIYSALPEFEAEKTTAP